MIKYYGTPLTPASSFVEILSGRNCLIPYPRPQDLYKGIVLCDKVIIDNGAFTIWNKGGTPNWGEYYKWLMHIHDNIEFFFIPDVIDGTEEENDNLIVDYFKRNITKGVPIWHVNESLKRLKRLMLLFDYIAIGSAGNFSQLGTDHWHKKMDKAMNVLCKKDGTPKVKIHMLRCLNPKLFTLYPFYSGDSTGLAQNFKRDGWEKIISRIEPYNRPTKYNFKKKDLK